MKIFLLGLSLFQAAMTLLAVASELRSIALTNAKGLLYSTRERAVRVPKTQHHRTVTISVLSLRWVKR